MKKILILEDDLASMMLYTEVFKRKGWDMEYKLIKCFNGLEALKKVKEIIPDIVISDLYMPLVSGLEFYNGIKSDERIHNIPIIIVTADHQAKNKYREALPDVRWIIKPIAFEKLIKVIEESILSSHNSQQQITQFPNECC